MYGGAIIHSIYEILKSNGDLDKCFNSKYVFENYNQIINQEKIINLFLRRNNDTIKTFKTRKNLYKWMYKHTYLEKVFWFEKCSKRGYFKLKKEYISRLEDERILHGIK